MAIKPPLGKCERCGAAADQVAIGRHFAGCPTGEGQPVAGSSDAAAERFGDPLGSVAASSSQPNYPAAPLELIDDLPRSRRHTCPYCGIPNDPPPGSLFTRISEQHNRCKVCGDVVSNSTEARDAHLSEKGCHA